LPDDGVRRAHEVAVPAGLLEAKLEPAREERSAGAERLVVEVERF